MKHDETLRAALLGYHASPGKYHVGRRQPEVLFGAIRQVLQLAIGRSADEELRQAAGFFIRSALLHSGSDHYGLLGLERSADAAAIKDRYRLMMRLLHPDFTAAEPGVWPAGAPARVNLAYEVLSTPALRCEYDGSLGGAKAAAPRSRVNLPVSMRRRVQERGPQRPARKGLGAIVVACSLAGVALLSATLLLGAKEVGQLVQRAPDRPAAPSTEQAEIAMPAPASLAMPPALPADLPAALPAIADTARAEVPAAPAEPQPAREAPSLAVPMTAPATTATAAPAPAATIEPPVVMASVMPAVVASTPPLPLPLPLPLPPPPPPQPRPVAGLTLAEAQPLLVSVLQHVQSGKGERLLTLLDRDARTLPAALALSRQLDALADGARPVKLTHVEFKAEPGEGRLYVTGHMQLHFDAGTAAPAKRLSLRAEFVSRNGTVVLTALSGMDGN